ncbi:MAG TPA: NAD(+) synthase [Devosia sp.]|nr:NAD(+) synthase [Devosia sp.]
MLHVLPEFSADALQVDAARETDRIVAALRTQLRSIRRRGLVLGLSGGIDSSVSVALAVRAVGARNVQALLMPERDSDPESRRLGELVAATFGIEPMVEDIGPTLDALGCYARRDAAVRSVVPDYGAGWACKVVIGQSAGGDGYNISSLVVRAPDGTQTTHRLPLAAYLGVVAATNMKQRTRKQFEYYHADRLNFAVLGTPNRLEYDQGFFVKNGDGAADVKPIAHLYKSQVYALAEYLGVPEEIRRRPPTTDTYSLPQSQEEFYFALPYGLMDLCLYGLNHGVAAEAVAAAAKLTEAQVHHVWRDIAAKRKATQPLHAAPLLVEPVREVEA